MPRLLTMIFASIAALAGIALPAYAQDGAGCPISAQSPFTIALATYTLSSNDQCAVIVFSWSASPVAVSVPAANTLAPGYQVTVLAKNNNIVLTPLGGGTINGASSSTVSAGLSATLYSNGSAAYVTTGSADASAVFMTKDGGTATAGAQQNLANRTSQPVLTRAPTRRDDANHGFVAPTLGTTNATSYWLDPTGKVWQIQRGTAGNAVWSPLFLGIKNSISSFSGQELPCDFGTSLFCGGTKILKSAYSSHLVNLIRLSDGDTKDIDIDSTGRLVLTGTTTSMDAWIGPNGIARLKQLYSQSGVASTDATGAALVLQTTAAAAGGGSGNVLTFADASSVTDGDWVDIDTTINTTGTTHTSTTIDAIPSTVGMAAGQPISGTGISAGTTIASVSNSTTIVLSQATTAGASGVSIVVSNTIPNVDQANDIHVISHTATTVTLGSFDAPTGTTIPAVGLGVHVMFGTAPLMGGPSNMIGSARSLLFDRHWHNGATTQFLTLPAGVTFDQSKQTTMMAVSSQQSLRKSYFGFNTSGLGSTGYGYYADTGGESVKTTSSISFTQNHYGTATPSLIWINTKENSATSLTAGVGELSSIPAGQTITSATVTGGQLGSLNISGLPHYYGDLEMAYFEVKSPQVSLPDRQRMQAAAISALNLPVQQRDPFVLNTNDLEETTGNLLTVSRYLTLLHPEWRVQTASFNASSTCTYDTNYTQYIQKQYDIYGANVANKVLLIAWNENDYTGSTDPTPAVACHLSIIAKATASGFSQIIDLLPPKAADTAPNNSNFPVWWAAGEAAIKAAISACNTNGVASAQACYLDMATDPEFPTNWFNNTYLSWNTYTWTSYASSFMAQRLSDAIAQSLVGAL